MFFTLDQTLIPSFDSLSISKDGKIAFTTSDTSFDTKKNQFLKSSLPALNKKRKPNSTETDKRNQLFPSAAILDEQFVKCIWTDAFMPGFPYLLLCQTNFDRLIFFIPIGSKECSFYKEWLEVKDFGNYWINDALWAMTSFKEWFYVGTRDGKLLACRLDFYQRKLTVEWSVRLCFGIKSILADSEGLYLGSVHGSIYYLPIESETFTYNLKVLEKDQLIVKHEQPGTLLKLERKGNLIMALYSTQILLLSAEKRFLLRHGYTGFSAACLHPSKYIFSVTLDGRILCFKPQPSFQWTFDDVLTKDLFQNHLNDMMMQNKETKDGFLYTEKGVYANFTGCCLSQNGLYFQSCFSLLQKGWSVQRMKSTSICFFQSMPLQFEVKMEKMVPSWDLNECSLTNEFIVKLFKEDAFQKLMQLLSFTQPKPLLKSKLQLWMMKLHFNQLSRDFMSQHLMNGTTDFSNPEQMLKWIQFLSGLELPMSTQEMSDLISVLQILNSMIPVEEQLLSYWANKTPSSVEEVNWLLDTEPLLLKQSIFNCVICSEALQHDNDQIDRLKCKNLHSFYLNLQNLTLITEWHHFGKCETCQSYAQLELPVQLGDDTFYFSNEACLFCNGSFQCSFLYE